MKNIKFSRCRTKYRRNGYGNKSNGLAASIDIYGKK